MSEITAPSIEDYVLQEAREKAFEISVEGLKEYEKAVELIVLDKKEKIEHEFACLHRDEEIARRIKVSSGISESRLRKMKERQELISSLLTEVEERVMQRLADGPTYRKFVLALLLQSMLRLGEKEASIRSLPEEAALMEEVISEAEQKYSEIVRAGAENCPPTIRVHLDRDNPIARRVPGQPLEEGYNFIAKAQEDRMARGGVLLTSADGLIVCKNTVDVRLEMCYQESLPEIRKLLFDSD
jgi:V-type H+-transporting ATPase subunit E